MRMIALDLSLDLPFYELEEAREAWEAASRSGAALYTYKTSGRDNWLDRGASVIDALGLVVLPSGLPNQIAMPPDPMCN
jgi:hypothetical protein